MAQTTMVSGQIESGAEFLRRLEPYIPVTAAFWAKHEEYCPWYLYVASEKINDANVRDAYGHVSRVIRENDDLTIDPFEVKLISASDPMARDVLRLRGPKPGIPTVYVTFHLGGEPIEGPYVHIYPSPLDRKPS